MSKYNLFLLNLGLLLSIAPIVLATDSTLVSGATGTSVVTACVAKIDDSDIFTEDYKFLRYLAHVESTDGTTLDTGDVGGIWKVTETDFNSIATKTHDVSSFYPAIQSNFSIDWETVNFTELSKPLYSAIAMRLHLSYLESFLTQSLPSSIVDQGLWWTIRLHSGDTDFSTDVYQAQIASLLTGCVQPERDVVFLIDTTFASGQPYLDEAKSFVSNVITQLKIDSNFNSTVIGIAQYSSTLQVVSYLNGSANQLDVTQAVSGITLSSGSRFTATACVQAIEDLFSTANGAKGLSYGVPRTLVVVTASDSDDNVTSVSATAASAGVGIIAVGMTDDASEEELKLLASHPDADHVFHKSTYSASSDLEFNVAEQICDESFVTPLGTVISGVVSPGKPKLLQVAISIDGLSFEITTTQGTLTLYYSATNQHPSSAVYDYQLTVPQTNQPVSGEYIPTIAEIAQTGSNTVNLYITMECTSSEDAHFTITIGITINDNTAPAATTTSSNNGLTDGEIAGIVFSCLIFLCAVIVAVVYYRFGKFKPRNFHAKRQEKLDRLVDSRKSVIDKEITESAMSQGHMIEKTDVPQETTAEQTTLEDENKCKNIVAQERRMAIEIRQRLHSAVRRRDVSDMTVAVEDFRAMRLDDTTGDYMKAQRMISVHQCKEGITRAINFQNIKILEKAIFEGKRMEYDPELKMELINAEILLQDLKKLENLLRKLKKAMDAGDLDQVERLTAELRNLKGCDQAMVERMLRVFQLKEELETAMAKRDIEALRMTLAKIAEQDFHRDMIIEVKQAKKLLKDLEYVEMVRKDVISLHQSRVSEIRSYGNPPPGVHEVMMAVYLLLNYNPMQLQSWTAIQALMGKTGKESLRRMVAELNAPDVNFSKATMAKQLLQRFDLLTIKEISEGLGVFYIFALTITNEVDKLAPDSYYGQSDSSPAMHHTMRVMTSYRDKFLGMTPVVGR